MGRQITEEEFAGICRFVKDRYGLDMFRKKEIVQGRLENYVQARGFANYRDYMNAVERDSALERDMINILTTNHTFFMREFEHFEYLRQVVLPHFRITEEKNKDLCIWCGAASTGQEPYILAMLLKDFFGLEHEQWDTKVLATDVSTQVLEHAVHGIYGAEQIAPLPEKWKRRYLRPLQNGGQYEITEEIKSEVLFRQFNLMDPFPFRRKMHIVFLRNVMIYFDKETKRQLIQKVYDSMETGGYLFIGQTETIEKESVPFEKIMPSVFRKTGGAMET